MITYTTQAHEGKGVKIYSHKNQHRDTKIDAICTAALIIFLIVTFVYNISQLSIHGYDLALVEITVLLPIIIFPLLAMSHAKVFSRMFGSTRLIAYLHDPKINHKELHKALHDHRCKETVEMLSDNHLDALPHIQDDAHGKHEMIMRDIYRRLERNH